MVDEGHGEEEHDGGDGGLVEEELRGVHGEFLVVGADEDGVDRGGADAAEGEDDADGAGGGDGGGGGFAGGRDGAGLDVVVGGETDADADGDEGEAGVLGDGGPVEDEVDDGGHGGEEDAAELVDGDGGEGEGEVGEHDVETHGKGELGGGVSIGLCILVFGVVRGGSRY